MRDQNRLRLWQVDSYIFDRNTLTLSKSSGFRVHHGQCRDAVQHGLNGAKDAAEAVFAGLRMAEFFQLFQRNRTCENLYDGAASRATTSNGLN